MLEEVKELKSGGVFERVAGRSYGSCGGGEASTVEYCWSRKNFEKAWNHLMDDGTEIMGLYGMGGVGKTTLLERINNKFKVQMMGLKKSFMLWFPATTGREDSR
ncbi:unnamed protein product [Microthlaspi erraticum]|uniref:NB-ARC domain-containing protein n=1 Tax=Microthlaspi erraticum TaxID=1685480 RepID=A0A6D2IJF2_9BRAS|nr:unnamed protein product [Microthlaspi erraticum]